MFCDCFGAAGWNDAQYWFRKRLYYILSILHGQWMRWEGQSGQGSGSQHARPCQHGQIKELRKGLGGTSRELHKRTQINTPHISRDNKTWLNQQKRYKQSLWEIQVSELHRVHQLSIFNLSRLEILFASWPLNHSKPSVSRSCLTAPLPTEEIVSCLTEKKIVFCIRQHISVTLAPELDRGPRSENWLSKQMTGNDNRHTLSLSLFLRPYK